VSDVVVVGSVNADTSLRVSDLPRKGETVLAADVQVAMGGKGANQAVTCARQGAATAFIGRVGDDAVATTLRDGLAAEGLDLRGLGVAPGRPSGQAYITVGAGGANTVVVVPGANGAVDVGDLEPRLFEGAGVVLVQLEIPVEVVEAALRLGRSVGAVTILNPAPAVGLAPEVLTLADFLVPNETEAAVMSGVSAPADAALALQRRTGGVVIVTVGADGAVVADGRRCWTTPSPAVTAVDTTAAGDAFCGVLAAGLAMGLDLDGSIVRAGAGGAHAATVAGAWPSLPTAAQVDTMVGGRAH
jgi:ribokinase